MTRRTGPRQIREMLQARVRELVAQLFPHDRVTLPIFTPLNPTRDDRKPGSFVIWMTGPAAGGFKEYAGDLASGDIIDLIAYVHGRDKAFAFKWAEDFLGLRDMDAATLKQSKERARRRAKDETQSQSAFSAKRRAGAGQLWGRAQPEIVGTVVEEYLARRGIPYRALQNLETDLRFAPALEWWRGAEWGKDDQGQRVKLSAGPKFPAMVAALRNHVGDLTAVHCTFLRADGTAKADVAKPKLMLGEVRYAVARLTRGSSGLSWEEAAANGVLDTLVIGEGIETMLSVATVAPEARIVAAGSADNIANAYIDHPCVDQVIVAQDADTGASAADRRARIIAALQEGGKPVVEMMPGEAGDFNDLINA